MKHATEATLRTLTGLLGQLRELPGVKERKPGIFYLKSRALLHFHEEEGKIYADVRLGGADFERVPASTPADRRRLFAAVRNFVR